MLSLSNFFPAFFGYLSIYMPHETDPNSQIPSLSSDQLQEAYDIIIVGGGTSGCVLANRLSENKALSILVLEAGADENAISDNPLLFRAAYNTELDWNFTTTSQSRICQEFPGRMCPFDVGHVVGGSSSIDTRWYARGNRKDYDSWAEIGNKDWSYENMLYYFKKMENCTIPSLMNTNYHGTKGSWPVVYSKYRTKLREEYVAAGQEFGWKKIDYNGESQNGIGYAQLALLGTTGSSTAQTYLKPVLYRKNLVILKNSLVSKILINGNNVRADGVEYIRYGRKYTVRAKREVILCAGPIQTPKLLILSGIGPSDELGRLGILPKAILPVGKNLQDQPIVDINFEINKRLTITTDMWRTNQSILAYTRDRNGPLTTTGLEAIAFFNSLKSGDVPNVAIQFFSWAPTVPLKKTQNEPLITARVTLLYPDSFGSVTLRSSNIYDDPIINPNYLATQTDYMSLERGIKSLFEFMRTPTMMKYSPMLNIEQAPECEAKTDNDLIRCLIKFSSFGLARSTGTARMGPSEEKNAVVNYKNLKVRSFKNLRIVDESVIPHAVRGNTLVATIAVAERAADIIKSYYKVEEQGSSPRPDIHPHYTKHPSYSHHQALKHESQNQYYDPSQSNYPPYNLPQSNTSFSHLDSNNPPHIPVESNNPYFVVPKPNKPSYIPIESNNNFFGPSQNKKPLHDPSQPNNPPYGPSLPTFTTPYKPAEPNNPPQGPQFNNPQHGPPQPNNPLVSNNPPECVNPFYGPCQFNKFPQSSNPSYVPLEANNPPHGPPHTNNPPHGHLQTNNPPHGHPQTNNPPYEPSQTNNPPYSSWNHNNPYSPSKDPNINAPPESNNAIYEDLDINYTVQMFLKTFKALMNYIQSNNELQ